MKNGKRDYKAELAWEKKNPQKHRAKDRAIRNSARKRTGIPVGSKNCADHKKELVDGGSNSKSNVQVMSCKANGKKESDRKKRNARG